MEGSDSEEQTMMMVTSDALGTAGSASAITHVSTLRRAKAHQTTPFNKSK